MMNCCFRIINRVSKKKYPFVKRFPLGKPSENELISIATYPPKAVIIQAPTHLQVKMTNITRTTIVVSNGRYTFYQIHFIKHNLSNTIYQIPFYQIPFIKYRLSNTIYLIPFIKYHLESKIFFNESMNQSLNRVFLERYICR